MQVIKLCIGIVYSCFFVTGFLWRGVMFKYIRLGLIGWFFNTTIDINKCTYYCVYCKIKFQILFVWTILTTFTPDLPVRNRNGDECLQKEILAQSFKNKQLINTASTKISASMKEGMYGKCFTLVFPLLVQCTFLLTNITFILFR